MTDVKDYVTDVESSEEFETGPYLVHVFFYDKGGTATTELGYYDEAADMITTYTLDPIARKPPERVFKKHEAPLGKLDIERASIGLDRAREIGRSCAAESYPSHPIQQEICILQQADGPQWNITLVFATLHLLNLKISASDGSIIDEDFRNIMDLRANG